MTLVTLCIAKVTSQDGPVPPRINIPGAIPLGAIPVPIRAPQFRNAIPTAGPALVRIRRPPQAKQQEQSPHLNAIPTHQRSLDEAKPVTEDPEDDISPAFIPHIVQQPHTQALLQSRDQFLETQAILPRFNPQERTQPIQRSQQERFDPEPNREQLFSFIPDRQSSIESSPAPPKQVVFEIRKFCDSILMDLFYSIVDLPSENPVHNLNRNVRLSNQHDEYSTNRSDQEHQANIISIRYFFYSG